MDGIVDGNPSPYEQLSAAIVFAAAMLYLLLWLGSTLFIGTIAQKKGHSPLHYLWATVLTLLGAVYLLASSSPIVLGGRPDPVVCRGLLFCLPVQDIP